MRFYKDNRMVPPIMTLAVLYFLWFLLDTSPAPISTTLQDCPSTASVSDPADAEKSMLKDHDRPVKVEQPNFGPGGIPMLQSEDVLLIIKTGGTVLWKRLPIHMSTTLSPERIDPRNTVIYAEVEAKIANHTVIDILSQLPASAKKSPNFELYGALRDWDATNFYVEQTGLPGDDEGPPGGWRLDKYKFLPMIQHAGTHWPQAKWYLYNEDDAYMFLPNVLRYLSTYDHREPHWLGGLGEKLGTTFAHGGSGFALSRAAWEQSFGKGGDLVKKYQGFVEDACCGDYALGKVLNDHGVRFGENDGDEGWSWGFNGLPHWKIEFTKRNWCLPVLTWHHAHNRDIARYHELEVSWDFNEKALNYGDFYAKIIAPSLSKRQGWWDNLSSRYEVHATTESSSPRPTDIYDPDLWSKAWKSVGACEAACLGWSACVQWYYYGDDCKMDDRVFMGHGWPEGMRYRKDKLESVSGWLTDRIEKWSCD